MRTIIVTFGVCMLVGGMSLAVREALALQHNSYSTPPDAGVLWYALGGPTPDSVAWFGADGLLEAILVQPLDAVLIVAGTCIALIGLSARNRN
jgi:hypothetical protein